MTIFNGGPASGRIASIKRAPFFLRVSKLGRRLSVLDKVDDVPEAGSELFAYQLTSKPGVIHVNSRRGPIGSFTTATYSFMNQQPAETILRERAEWQAWCQEKATAL